MKPRLLDLFCGAGGCTKGYQEAGFYVVGVDINPQPRYCGDEFVQGGAIEALESLLARGLNATMTSGGFLGSGSWVLSDFAAIHASPPCQASSAITNLTGNQGDHPELIPPARELLVASGLPYVIENVERAELCNPVTLCGATYCTTITDEAGQRWYLKRHRLCETNFPVMVEPCTCSPAKGKVLGVYGGGTRQKSSRPELRNERGWLIGGTTEKANREQASALMGIDWMTRGELCQAIPPAYTQAIGSYLLTHIEYLHSKEGRVAA